MKKFLHWFISVIGYGAYTLAVFVLLLWFLFPVESLRSWLVKKLDQQSNALTWEITDLRIDWPLSVTGEDILAKSKSSGESILQVDELKIRPDMLRLAKIGQEWPVFFQAQMLGGEVLGTGSMEKEQGKLECSGEMKNLQIDKLTGLWKQLGREVSGNLSGTFSCNGKRQELPFPDMKAELVIEDGSMELLQPVFGKESFGFSRLESELSMSKKVVTLEKGNVDSNLFAAEFEGTVTLADNFLGSGLNVNGSFEPRPELMGSLKNSAVVRLIKGQLREGKLTFTLSDTLQEPGISFQGVSGIIDGIIQRGSK